VQKFKQNVVTIPVKESNNLAAEAYYSTESGSKS
jgi:hypothetical protein